MNQEAANAVQINTWDWAQFGLAGMVIGAMFFILHHVVKMHNYERREWREDMKHLHTESNRTLDSVATRLESAIRSISKD